MDQQPPEQIQNELESFRRQWREEVSSRTKGSVASSSQQQQQSQSQQSRPAVPAVPAVPSLTSHKPPRRHGPGPQTAGLAPQHGKKSLYVEDEDDYVPAPVFEGDGSSTSKLKVAPTTDTIVSEPETALDYYEHAVEREAMGKLGDSLQLYRKAFRMDETVDRKYRDKHFAGRWAKSVPQPQQPQSPSQSQSQKQQQQISAANSATTVPNTASQSQAGNDGDPVIPLSFNDLIASFAGLKVQGAPPACEGVAPPPCPIADLPDEILLHILRDVAVADVADFMRLAQVCKSLAYLVITEDQIWRRVCLGPEFGFGGMHHHFQRGITWEPLPFTLSAALPGPDTGMNVDISTTTTALAQLQLDSEIEPTTAYYTPEELHRQHATESLQRTLTLHKTGIYTSWQSMFRHRPRVRFGGCYISTVNYIRPGQNAGQQLTWNTPVHIVTYYRYLRFFRDGTAISLLTTDEPAHVVHHLKRENMPVRRAYHAHHAANPATSNAMSAAFKGRWRLSSASDANESPRTGPEAAESDLYVETEGVGAKYIYRMDLSLGSVGRAAARNNKLSWRGFWSYNKLTDDWAQFALKNDKPFVFSRVRSYGIGE
ncbi:hypothetical protein GGR50DRAFT_665940 [Xylaria sp. CBS 124048]|nr:hypothetical protein GGR50DRAFT_665940 [Xylaria sp. CBS 124048]